MRTIDDFTRPLEYISPMDGLLGSIFREWVEKDVMPYRRQFDEDYLEHHLIHPPFNRLLGAVRLAAHDLPRGPGGMGHGEVQLHVRGRLPHVRGDSPRRLRHGHGLRRALLALPVHRPGTPREPAAAGGVRAHVLRDQRGGLHGHVHDRAAGRRRHRERGDRQGDHHPDHRGAGRRRVGDQRPQALALQHRRAGQAHGRGVHHQPRLRRPA